MAEHRRPQILVCQYLEIKEWARDLSEIKAEPESGKPKTSESLSIFKIPPRLLDVRQSAFHPEFFSFGSFHREDRLYDGLKSRHPQNLFGRMGLRDIDDHSFRDWKGDYDVPLQFSDDMVGDINKTESREGEVIEYPSRDPWDKVLRDLLDLVVKARGCYEPIGVYDLYDDEFNELFRMMITDGCFIVELLRLHSKFMTNDKKRQIDARSSISDSPIFEALRTLPSVQRDLIRLENQIPFFFLEKLYSMTTSANDEPSLKDRYMTFFFSMLSLDKSIYLLDPNPKRNYAHPLDLFRSSLIFSMRKKLERDEEVYRIPMGNPKLIFSAQELQDVGVKIVRKDNSSLLDISFDSHKGVLLIPPLCIDENMIVALLNFVAYEECDQSQKPYIINYLLFFHSLINTTKDVEILRRNRIISYPLGIEKEDVVNFFNSFCKERSHCFNQNYLSIDMNGVNNYCETFYTDKWRFWWSNLKRDRFSSPWTFLSLVAAIVLLILTMLQTFFTIFPYYHPN